MKSSPAPQSPDPKVTAAAQTGTNVSTAIANANLGNINQVTPNGSLTYSQSGSYKFKDPTTGAEYDVPQFTATTSLSPAQQAIQKQNDGTSLNLATTANQQSAFLQNYLGKGVDTSGIPGLQSTFSPTARGISYDIDSAGGIQRSIADAGPILREFGDAGAITKSYGTDFSADRQRVEDAMYSRLNPQIDRAREAEETRLQNQGIRIGSDAWKNAMSDFNSGVNDQRTSILLAGGQEQSRLVGLEANRAAFENSAQQQNYGQLLGRATFSNAAQAQQFGQNAQQAMFANQAQDQQFNQNAQRTAVNNSAQAQNFAQNAQYASFNNQARSQGISEAYAARNQPINEIAALMNGAQVQNPSFVNTSAPTIPTTDYAGLVSQDYQNKMSAWQQQQAQKQQMMGGLFSLGSAAIMASERRLKRDIRRVGTGPRGLPVYAYRYRSGGAFHLGFMLDEVAAVMPSAIRETGAGFQAVDYAAVMKEAA